MICQACGAENKDGVRFCQCCGKAFSDEPIRLDLAQIKVPAAARKAHIVKVNAVKKAAAAQTEAPAEEVPEANIPETDVPAEAPEHEEAFIPLSEQQPAAAEESESNTQEPPAADPAAAPMCMKSWLGVFVLLLLPVVNFIMLLVWSFSSKTNKSKQSFARMLLIFTAVLLVLSVALVFVYAAFFNTNLLHSLNHIV